MNRVGYLLHEQGKLILAEPFLRRSLEGRERTLGREHPHTLTVINNMGFLMQDKGKRKEAEPFFRRALEGHERISGKRANGHSRFGETFERATCCSQALERGGKISLYLYLILHNRRQLPARTESIFDRHTRRCSSLSPSRSTVFFLFLNPRLSSDPRLNLYAYLFFRSPHSPPLSPLLRGFLNLSPGGRSRIAAVSTAPSLSAVALNRPMRTCAIPRFFSHTSLLRLPPLR